MHRSQQTRKLAQRNECYSLAHVTDNTNSYIYFYNLTATLRTKSPIYSDYLIIQKFSKIINNVYIVNCPETYIYMYIMNTSGQSIGT